MRGRYGRPVRDRDTLITVTKPTVAYDADGIEVVSTSTELTFWGKVTDEKDTGDVSVYKRLDARTIAIEADSRSVSTVSILDTLVTDQGTESYEVVDKYDTQWRFTAMIICKYKD